MPPLLESQFKQQAQAAALALNRAESGSIFQQLGIALTTRNAQPSPYYDTKVVDMLYQATTALRTNLAATPALADYMTNTLVEAVLTDFTKHSMPPKKIEGTREYASIDSFMKLFEGKPEIEDPTQITEAIVDIALRRSVEGGTTPKTVLESTTFLLASKSTAQASGDWVFTLFGGEAAATTTDIIRVVLSVKTGSTESVIILTPAKYNYLRPLAIVFGPLGGQVNIKTDVGVALMGFLDSTMAQQLDFLTLAAVGADGIHGQSPIMSQVLAGVKSLNSAAVQGAFLHYMNILIHQSDDIIRVGEARLQISAPAEDGTFRDVLAIAPAAVESARVTRAVIISVTDQMFGSHGAAAVATRITNMEEARDLVRSFESVLEKANADPLIINYTKAAGSLLVEVVETGGSVIDTIIRSGLKGVRDISEIVSIITRVAAILLPIAGFNIITGRFGHGMALVGAPVIISPILFAMGGGAYAMQVGAAIAAIYGISTAKRFYSELSDGFRAPQPGVLGNMHGWLVRATAPNPPRALLPDLPVPVPVAPVANRGGYRRRSKYSTRKRKNRHVRKTKSVRKSLGARKSRKN